MNEKQVDLRSDTVTHPTAAMYAAMSRAPLGDDGWRDDPTVLELESACASMLGKDAAVFVPTGTMANLVALMAHCGRGGEVLAETQSHIAVSEMGGIATVAGLSFRPVPGHRGAMDVAFLDAAIRPAISDRVLKTALICVENTHTAENGAVLPLAHMAEVKSLAAAAGIPVHLDGARIFNAAVVLGVDALEIARHADSVAISLYKGLGAPAGAVLAGTDELIERAMMYRKMLGGTMRQAGLLAACGLVGLRDMVGRLEHDHLAARKLAAGLNEIDARLIDPADVETNLLTVDTRHTGRTAQQWASELKDRGVLVAALPPWRLRLVTHWQIDDAAVARCVDAFRALSQRLQTQPMRASPVAAR